MLNIKASSILFKALSNSKAWRENEFKSAAASCHYRLLVWFIGWRHAFMLPGGNMYVFLERFLFPLVHVCLVSVEKPNRSLPQGWIPGDSSYLACPGWHWWHLWLLCPSQRMLTLQNEVFAVLGGWGRDGTDTQIRSKSSRRSLSLRRWKFRSMPIYTSEMANYYQLWLGFFGNLDFYFLRTGSVHFM